MCGGTTLYHPVPPCTTGLSPRVRGNPLTSRAAGAALRSIPACAGEPVRQADGPPADAVYPRVCGGTLIGTAMVGIGLGLSPRVRGNLVAGDCCNAVERSIPACAGEPDPAVTLVDPFWVYPRVCGGTVSRSWEYTGEGGLSPRVRGNLGDAHRIGPDVRSIPACAGEPRRGMMLRGMMRVYPRVCGGTPSSPGRCQSSMGLSPRVRGNRSPPGPSPVLRGSIPACAGEPVFSRVSFVIHKVYPRVCGGTTAPASQNRQRAGLSPRVRGNPRVPLNGTLELRSIPACAGEPSSNATLRYSTRVYPRVCGGTVD